MAELYHYGVKHRSGRYPYGSGERPYQSERFTQLDRKKANAIFDTMSDKEKYYLTADKNAKQYVAKGEYDRKTSSNVYSLITEHKDTPMSVIDVWYDGKGTGEVSIGVSKKGRGLGYGKQSVEKMLDWFEENDSGVERLMWGVNKNNKASIELAKKYGFVKVDDIDDEWVTYMKRR